MFWRLCAYRVDRGRLPPSVIMDYLTLHGAKISRWEVKALEAMDSRYCSTLAEETRLNDERRKAAQASSGKRGVI